jgi:hypothetical protein
MKQAIGCGKLRIRGELDGVPMRLKPTWIGFLEFFLDEKVAPPWPARPDGGQAPPVREADLSDKPDDDCLMFDLQKVAAHRKKIGDKRHRYMKRVVVERAALDRLWPGAVSAPAATEHVAPDAPAPANAKLPRFDARKAKALLVAKKVGGDWVSPPTEDDSRTFLLANFNGVPNDPHRRIRREVWPGLIKTGPRPKRRTAE